MTDSKVLTKSLSPFLTGITIDMFILIDSDRQCINRIAAYIDAVGNNNVAPRSITSVSPHNFRKYFH